MRKYLGVLSPKLLAFTMGVIGVGIVTYQGPMRRSTRHFHDARRFWDELISGFHGLTLADRDLANLARNLRFDRGLIDRLQRARKRKPARERRRLDESQVRRRELERDYRGLVRGLGCRALARAQAHPTGKPADDQDCNKDADRSASREPPCHDSCFP